MTQSIQVAVLVGSLRKKSLSREVARALIERAPASLRCEVVAIGDLPLYDEDLETEAPHAWTRFRAALTASEAFLFVTPEYNRSIPGGLKNAIDVGSRPEKANVFAGKPAAIASVTPYKLGAFGANHALRQALVFLDTPAMQQPELYIGGAGEWFDESGRLKDEAASKRLSHFMSAFASWTEAVRARSLQKTDGEPFDAFLRRREKVGEAYVNGDAAPLRDVTALRGDATFLAPSGGAVSGAEKVFARYEKDAGAFAPGGRSRFEVLQSRESGDLAFWTGFQVAEANLKGEKQAVPMRLRVTEVFRREGGAWRMIHRHGDMNAEDKAKR